MSEFSIIKNFFQREVKSPDVILGSGDDCAIVQVPIGYQLALSIDTMVLDVHFTLACKACDIGYKAVTSTLSDLAAMGAEPRWLTGSLTLPNADEQWLSEFSQGLYAAIDSYGVSLIGGDLTQGPLTITFQAQGIVPNGLAVRRSGAQSGDLVYVTNTVGDAAYGLQLPEGNVAQNRPDAQIAAGLVMRQFATSCIDISDGLLQDLQHVLTASDVGANVYLPHIPLSAQLLALPLSQVIPLALTGGEDYQLLMTLPKDQQAAFEQAMPTKVTCIGEINVDKKLQVFDAQGKCLQISKSGYQHFKKL